MAVAPRNGPLPSHMKSKFRRICVGLIGDNAPSKQICFSPAMSRSKAHKALRWCSNDGDGSRIAIGAFWGLETGSLPEKSIFACSGHRHPLIKHVVAFFWPLRWHWGAISGGGGHGDVCVVGRLPLAVGHLVLLLARILHNSWNSINVHTQRIFFRSKIFRPV